MYKAFTDQLMFNKVIQVKNVGELNMAVKNCRTAEPYQRGGSYAY